MSLLSAIDQFLPSYPDTVGFAGPVDSSDYFGAAMTDLGQGLFGDAGANLLRGVANFGDNFLTQAPGLAHDVQSLPQTQWSGTHNILTSVDNLFNLKPIPHGGATGWYGGVSLNMMDVGLGMLAARTGLGSMRPGLSSLGGWMADAGMAALDRALPAIAPFALSGTALQFSTSINTKDEWGWAALVSPFGNHAMGSTFWTGLSYPIATLNDDGANDGAFVMRMLADQRLTPGHVGINVGSSAWLNLLTGETKLSAYGPELNFSTNPNFETPGATLRAPGFSTPWFGYKSPNYGGK